MQRTSRPGEGRRVENGVGFVKKNLLAGLELADFSAMKPAATLWVDTVANVRIHRETHQRPIDRFEDERAHLLPLNPAGFDLARVCTASATKQFRIPLDTNHYTVPSRYAGQRLTLKAYAERVCIYARDQLIALHPRSMDRHKQIEDPDHERQLLAQRSNAREQRLVVNFLALSPRAQGYLEGLEAKRVNARVHLRKILALAELHGKQAVARALDDGLELHAFSAEYIANKPSWLNSDGRRRGSRGQLRHRSRRRFERHSIRPEAMRLERSARSPCSRC